MKLYKDNPRRISKKRFAELTASLEELGDVSGIVHDLNSDQIIGGNQRSTVFDVAKMRPIITETLDAPTKQGTVAWGYVEWHGERFIYRAVRWTDEQCRKGNIKANIAAGVWDWDGLAGWPDLDKMGFDADLLATWNADGAALATMLQANDATGDADAEPQIDRAAELNEKWQVKTGDLWRIGEHRLLCGDSTKREDVERVMQGRKVGACVTDSPYGINREGIENDDPEGLRKLFDGVLSAIPIDNGIIINFQSPRLFPVWLDAIRAAKHKFERMLWMYKPNDETFPWRGWLQKSEAILISSKGSGEWLRVDPFAHDCYSQTTLGSELPKEWGKVHASVKPLVVVQDLISRIGGDVYEPFAGSGTTLVGCENLGRVCFALESKPVHCAVILERMSTAFPGIEIERIE